MTAKRIFTETIWLRLVFIAYDKNTHQIGILTVQMSSMKEVRQKVQTSSRDNITTCLRKRTLKIL